MTARRSAPAGWPRRARRWLRRWLAGAGCWLALLCAAAGARRRSRSCGSSSARRRRATSSSAVAVRAAARRSKRRCDKGVPMYFVAEAEVFRERWYWRDRKRGAARRATCGWPTSRSPALALNVSPCRSPCGFGVALNQNSTPWPSARRASARRPAGRWPSRPDRRRAAATTSSSASGSTPRSCRGRCRSAWRPGRLEHLGIERSAAARWRSAVTERRAPQAVGHEPVARSRACAGPSRRCAAIRRRAWCSRSCWRWPPTTATCTSATTSGCSGSTWSVAAAAGAGDRLIAAARLLLRLRQRQVRQPAADQAGRHLRAGRRGAGRADLHGVATSSCRAASRAGSTSRWRARSTPA